MDILLSCILFPYSQLNRELFRLLLQERLSTIWFLKATLRELSAETTVKTDDVARTDSSDSCTVNYNFIWHTHICVKAQAFLKSRYL